MGVSPFLKDTKEGASATDAGKEIHNGFVRGKKLNLKESVDLVLSVLFHVCRPCPGCAFGQVLICWYVYQVDYYFVQKGQLTQGRESWLLNCTCNLTIIYVSVSLCLFLIVT